jgi:hypothetical protein
MESAVRDIRGEREKRVRPELRADPFVVDRL